ncbi:hypothetical protein [Bifidobacterium pullorum]|nr:hypothetical protein [Bifidobacterium pullorum]
MTDLNETTMAGAGGLDGDQTAAPEARDGRGGKPSRHAIVMRGVVTPILGLLAVAAILLGWLNATEWRPSTEVTARMRVTDTRYVVTDPGVLPLVDDAVTLEAKASGRAGQDQQVCAAVGNAKDATGWLAGNPYVRVTGMTDWTTLSSQRASASGQSAPEDGQVAFADSDMWRSVDCGATSATLTLKKATAAEVVLIDLGRKTDATVSMHWTRSSVPDFAMPFFFVAGLLAVLAALTASVFAMPPHKRRKRIVESRTKPVEEVAVGEAIAGSLSGLKTAVSFKPRAKRRRRHAAGAVPADAALREQSQPTIVDPASRNLVADAASAPSEEPAPAADSAAPAPAGGVDDATSVISPAELQSYFARLAQEMGDEDQKGEDR